MKDIIIVGNNNFADLMRYYWENDASRRVVAYTVEKDYVGEKVHEDLPVVPLERIETIYPPERYTVSLCIGYSKMNTVRERIFKICVNKGYELENFIHSTAFIEKDVKLGTGNIFLSGVKVEPFCEIGNSNFFFAGATISHNAKIGNFNFFGGSSIITGFVNVQNNCFIGANATIKNNLSIPSFVLIGAGAYLSENPKECETIVPEKSKVLKDILSINLI